jgi:hypothetical protein
VFLCRACLLCLWQLREDLSTAQQHLRSHGDHGGHGGHGTYRDARPESGPAAPRAHAPRPSDTEYGPAAAAGRHSGRGEAAGAGGATPRGTSDGGPGTGTSPGDYCLGLRRAFMVGMAAGLTAADEGGPGGPGPRFGGEAQRAGGGAHGGGGGVAHGGGGGIAHGGGGGVAHGGGGAREARAPSKAELADARAAELRAAMAAATQEERAARCRVSAGYNFLETPAAARDDGEARAGGRPAAGGSKAALADMRAKELAEAMRGQQVRPDWR